MGSKRPYSFSGGKMDGLKRVDKFGSDPLIEVLDKIKVLAGSSIVNEGAVVGAQTLVAAPVTLTAADSGKELYFNSATGISITLPAKALGLRFNVRVKIAPTSGNHILKTPAGAKIIQGGAVVNGGDIPAILEEQINFVASTSLVGDCASVVCDGDLWYAEGRSGTTAALTFTEPT